MDPDTLETLGLYDFDGQLPCLTFTAHPKFDPVSREMVCFGYEAQGDATNDICYYTFDKDGKLGELVWLVSPICGMIHDFAVTENYVRLAFSFPLPSQCRPNRIFIGPLSHYFPHMRPGTPQEWWRALAMGLQYPHVHWSPASETSQGK